MTADRLLQQEAAEGLRQSTESSKVDLAHRKRMDRLELTMGYVALALLPLLAVFTVYLLASQTLRPAAEAIAASALVTETVAAIAMVMRVILNRQASQAADGRTDPPRLPSAVFSPGVVARRRPVKR